jgi:hypothetical protein
MSQTNHPIYGAGGGPPTRVAVSGIKIEVTFEVDQASLRDVAGLHDLVTTHSPIYLTMSTVPPAAREATTDEWRSLLGTIIPMLDGT